MVRVITERLFIYNILNINNMTTGKQKNIKQAPFDALSGSV